MGFCIYIYTFLHTSCKYEGLQTELQPAQNRGAASVVQDTNLLSHASFRWTQIPMSLMGVQQHSEIKTKHSSACGCCMGADVKQFC